MAEKGGQSGRSGPRKKVGDAGRSAGTSETRIGWQMAGIGFAVASEVAAGTLLGFAIDHIWGVGPRWVVVGAVIGIAVAMWNLIRGTLNLNRQLDEETRGRRLPPPISDKKWQQMDEEERENDEF